MYDYVRPHSSTIERNDTLMPHVNIDPATLRILRAHETGITLAHLAGLSNPMTVQSQVQTWPVTSGKRRIKAHSKSKQGCRNCKLRSVKCDETKPQCRKCGSYGVMCNYDGTNLDLHLKVEAAALSGVLITETVLPSYLPYRISEHEQVLRRFRNRTSLTVSDGKRLKIYQNEIITLAHTSSYLMHTLLTLTLMHDRFLSPVFSGGPSSRETYHCYQAAATLQKQLALPMQVAEQAGLWVASALLSIIVFAQVDGESAEDVWPLRPNSTPTIDWIKIGKGKREIFNITSLLHDDPFFSALTVILHPETEFTLRTGPNFKQLPLPFIRLYNLSDTDTDEINHYRDAIVRLARVLDPLCHPVQVIMEFWGFTNMTAEFKALLGCKDPRALLILAYWYMRASQLGVWWLRPRTYLEGRAICMYLDRYHSDDLDIRSLLQYPKAAFRLLNT
ncbi:hypothetical protein LTR84_003862 [Exophiala bonariae]|uniref:Zn(2)-C6 fungal-type domain-containing protein n=1 Tax=Exophiala bonariae TaxID=1690606 RepID=A0AAV9N978_9EURO|nr:hypothetical protein LTR84_003862 [Exophiala bonariae]